MGIIEIETKSVVSITVSEMDYFHLYYAIRDLVNARDPESKTVIMKSPSNEAMKDLQKFLDEGNIW